MDAHWGPGRDQGPNEDRIPVCETDAAMASSTSDRFRIWGAVNSVAGVIQLHPEDPNWISWPGRNVKEIFRSFTSFQHAFVIAEPWKRRDPGNFPISDRRWMVT